MNIISRLIRIVKYWMYPSYFTRVLYHEMMTFKDSPDFHEKGFSASSPYRKWLEKVDIMRAATRGSYHYNAAHDVRSAAIGYALRAGKETDFTRHIKKRMK